MTESAIVVVTQAGTKPDRTGHTIDTGGTLYLSTETTAEVPSIATSLTELDTPLVPAGHCTTPRLLLLRFRPATIRHAWPRTRPEELSKPEDRRPACDA